MNRFIISSFALCGLLGFVACTTEDAEETTTSTNTTSTTDNTGGSGGSTTSQGGGTTSAGGMGGAAQGGNGGGGVAITAVCAGLADTPDATCITPGTGLVDCNPVSGATENGACGDDTPANTACDSAGVDDYECFEPGTVACGAACDSTNDPCEAGYTCTDKGAFSGTEIGDNPVCARWCCDDADCGGGVCVSVEHASMSLGVCLSAAP